MNKKIISIALVLSMLIGMLAMLPITIGAAEVTADNADIVIKSVDDWIKDLSNGNSIGSKTVFVEAKELDFTGKTVKPIKDFSGKFNGNGVVIKNLSIVTTGETGMFGCSKAGSEPTIVENFVITDSYFEGKKWVGAVFCCVSGDVTVRNVFVSGSVKVHATDQNAGGIIGAPAKAGENITIEDCVVAANVYAEGKVNEDNVGGCSGGIIGQIHRQNNNVVINNCLVTAYTRKGLDGTSGKSPSSGFVGAISNGSLAMTNCIYAGGAESDYFASFPLFKNTVDVTVNNCYTTHVCESKGYENQVFTDTTYQDAGVTYLNKSRDSLIGKNCSTTVDGFTKRDGDIMVPDGVAGFSSIGIFVKYTVTWKDGNGEVLKTEQIQYGETPEYSGATPTKDTDDQFTYEFDNGWYPKLSTVVGDATYIAKFTKTKKDNVPSNPWSKWDGAAYESYTEEGSGTEEDPYIIRTAGQWANLAQEGVEDDGLYFELAANLNFNNLEGLNPIIKSGRWQILFDGKGHTIEGVNMNTKSGDGTGLFGGLWGGVSDDDETSDTKSCVKNLLITKSSFNGTKFVGAVVGKIYGQVDIENIYVDSSVVVNSTEGATGGIVGGGDYQSNNYSNDDDKVACIPVTIRNCVFAGRVTASNDTGTNPSKIGGIFGDGNSKDKELFNIVIENCVVTGYVQHTNVSHSSGFFGYNVKEYTGTSTSTVYKASVTLTNCIYAGGAEGTYFAGYPFGRSTITTVTNCYTTNVNSDDAVYVSGGSGVKYTEDGSGVKVIDDIYKYIGKSIIEEWGIRAGDIPVPSGVKDFAPISFTQHLLDGASVRLDKPTGLRFKAVLGKAFLDSIKTANEGKEVTYGIIITPEDYITEAGDKFTVEALSELDYETDYLEINADKLLDGGDDAGYYLFSGVIYDIDEGNYARKFSARAYVKVDDGNGNVTYYYSAYDSDVNSRSIAEVAKAAYEDTNNAVTDKYKYEVAENSGVYSPYEATKRALLPSFYEKVATDVYFMSYNIRNVEGGKLPFEYNDRQNAVVSYILSENPDVIGLQEVGAKDSTSWFDILGDEDTQVGLTANGYAVYVGTNTSYDDKSDYNPIYYKTSRFELVANGAGSELLLDENGDPYTYYNSREQKLEEESRGYTYVTLRDKKTGEIFVYVNTHLIRKTTTEGYEDYQDDMARDFAEALKAKAFEYPVIIGGDFNGSYSVYKEYKAEGDEKAYWGEVAVNARTEATTKISGCSTTNGNFDTLETSDGPIDLYFVVNAENTVIHSYAVTDNKTNVENVGDRYPSDHLPVKLVVTIYCDINQ